MADVGAGLAEGLLLQVADRPIRPYSGCGIRLLQENQCGIRFLYCYAVAKNWNSSERFTVFHLQ